MADEENPEVENPEVPEDPTPEPRVINFIFLEKEDLESQMFEAYIDDDNDEDIEAMERIEVQSIATFKTKLRQRYNVDEVFNKTETERDPEVVKHLAAFVCYYMIRRNAARKVPSDYVKEFEMAQKWLENVRAGIEVPNLPKIETRQELRWGSSRNEGWLV